MLLEDSFRDGLAAREDYTRASQVTARIYLTAGGKRAGLPSWAR